MAWIALDAGTSVIKAVAFAADGRELALARRQTTVLHPEPAFSEQDMTEVWSSVVQSVREVVAQLGEPIQGIVSTAQGDGAWLVDEAGAPTGNAILWNDGRAADFVQQWHADGTIASSFRSSGSVTYPGLPNAILRWLDQQQSDQLHRARWTLSCNGWIFLRLTELFRADLSDASNPFGDLRTHGYSSAVVSMYGLQNAEISLPPIVVGKSSSGKLAARPAEELGLAPGTPCIMAPYDIIATAYGAGATTPGQACVILGTTICAEVITANVDLDASPAGTTIALHDGHFLRAMPTLTGCEALDWAARTLGVANLSSLEDLASTAQPAAGNIVFLPYLSPAGERSPFLDTDARGSFHNLSLRSTRADMARAVYEGLSFVIRECLATATVETLSELRVCGGGARSNFWCQMIADVTGLPVLRASDNEIGARGAWLFAMEVTGAAGSIHEAAERHVTISARFTPEAGDHASYSRLYRRFLHLREHAVAQWQIGASG